METNGGWWTTLVVLTLYGGAASLSATSPSLIRWRPASWNATSAADGVELLDLWTWLVRHRWRAFIDELDELGLPLAPGVRLTWGPVLTPTKAATTGVWFPVSSSGDRSLVGLFFRRLVSRSFLWRALGLALFFKILVTLFVTIVLPNILFLVMMNTDDMEDMRGR